MTSILNRSNTLLKRRRLRAKSTKSEKLLWEKLRNKKLQGLKFRRQYSIGPYIADFYSPKIKLAIELDGAGHFTEEALEYDRKREEYIKSLGIRILRFSNEAVYDDLSGVLKEIAELDPLRPGGHLPLR